MFLVTVTTGPRADHYIAAVLIFTATAVTASSAGPSGVVLDTVTSLGLLGTLGRLGVRGAGAGLDVGLCVRPHRSTPQPPLRLALTRNLTLDNLHDLLQHKEMVTISTLG